LDASPSSALEYSKNDDSVASDVIAASTTDNPHVNFIQRPKGPLNTSASRGMGINDLVSNHSEPVNLDQNRAPIQMLNQVWTDRTPATNLQHQPSIGQSSDLHEEITIHSAEAFLSSPEYVSQDLDMWNITYDPAWTSWSVDSDFDLDAVNASIADTINHQHGYMYGLGAIQNNQAEPVVSSLSKPANSQTLTESVERSWCSYTRHESDITPGTITPVMENDNTERQDVDEAYRYNLSSQLQQRFCKCLSNSHSSGGLCIAVRLSLIKTL
jgi:hypothetical protein